MGCRLYLTVWEQCHCIGAFGTNRTYKTKNTCITSTLLQIITVKINLPPAIDRNLLSQKGRRKIADIYKIWHLKRKNPIHILYISCILQQPFLTVYDFIIATGNILSL